MTNTSLAGPSGAGDLPEVERLVKSAVARQARRSRCTASEQADLIQDGIIAGLRAASNYDSTRGASKATWITRRVVGQVRDSLAVLRNHGVTHRPRGFQVFADSTFHVDNGSTDSDGDDEAIDSVSELVDRSQEAQEDAAFSTECLERLQRRLPADYLQLLDWLFVQELSLRDIAARLDVSHQAVATKLQRALDRARRLMEIPKNVTSLH